MATIGFIGLGNMGGPMATNLVKAGHTVQVFDLSKEAVQRLESAGATGCASAAEAATGVAIVVTMLPAGRHVRELYLGEGGLLATAAKGTLLVDSSTIDADTARAVAAEAEQAGCPMIDAPVSGGVAGAEAGKLIFMVGGDTAPVEQARPILDVMGRAVFHAGPAGAGQVAKMCNNMLLAISMIGTSEAINLGIAEGLDPKALSDIMQQSSGGNWVLNGYNPHPDVMDGTPASRGYTGGFGTALMLKDLGLAMDAALKDGKATPLGALARNIYTLHDAAGNGHKDFSSVIQFLQNGGSTP
ncbi:3-hydroxyisobutyrate dehydrogenase [Aquisalimonas asiatica]|uniref:3-hydroxyisobutyrate dehydrogenase n=1 Tax=Aquisalimonas asiatica TaxID=406100 RepID=A0A1H8UVS1_9GAMM|nr:3-hydroxyisobutyrate dehydrogenase [Aquisalimonas asiatica]SEP06678.1 3-hydroxyisobutyrate dehydrogenase [Aquisalimonas asiatica]